LHGLSKQSSAPDSFGAGNKFGLVLQKSTLPALAQWSDTIADDRIGAREYFPTFLYLARWNN